MKKIIIILVAILLSGCTQMQRYFMSDVKKPEKNVLEEPVSGVTLAELDFSQYLPDLKDNEKYYVGTFFSDGEKLYFSYNEKLDSDAGGSISLGVYAYDLVTKTLEERFLIPASDKYSVKSIVVVDSKLYISGGYLYKDVNQIDFEVSWIHDQEKTVLLNEQLGSYSELPSLYNVDESTFAFVETTTKKQAETSEIQISLKLIDWEFHVTTIPLFEYKEIEGETKDSVLLFDETITVQEGYFAFASYQNSTSWLNRYKRNNATGVYEKLEPIKIGKSLSPQSMMLVDEHWYVVTINNETIDPWVLNVYDNTTGEKVAIQYDVSNARISVYTAINDKYGLVNGAFNPDSRYPVTNRLYLGWFEKNTVKYQRIDELIYADIITEIEDGIYLARGKVDYQNQEYKYYLMELDE